MLQYNWKQTAYTLTACIRGSDLSKVISVMDGEQVAPATPLLSVSSSSVTMTVHKLQIRKRVSIPMTVRSEIPGFTILTTANHTHRALFSGALFRAAR